MLPSNAVAVAPAVMKKLFTLPVLGLKSASSQYPSFLPDVVTTSMPHQMMQASRSIPNRLAAALS